MIKTLAERIRDKRVRPQLFHIVAAHLRGGELDSEAAEIIASWFDRLAVGESPNDVLAPGGGRGRPRGSNNVKHTRESDVKRPDDIELCWNIRRLIAEGHKKATIFARVSKIYGLKASTVADIYRATLPKLPD